MGAAERRALWARDKGRPAGRPGLWWGEAVTRAPAAPGYWRVVRENDAGKVSVLRDRVSEKDAHRLAGMARDRCPDSDVAAGWNYLARKCPWVPGGAPQVAAEPLLALEMAYAAVAPGLAPKHGRRHPKAAPVPPDEVKQAVRTTRDIAAAARRLGMHPKGLERRLAFDRAAKAR